MEDSNQDWNSELANWHRKSGKTISAIAREGGIPKTSFSEYLSGKVKDLGKLSEERKDALYKLTGLECFKTSYPAINLNKINGTEVPQNNGKGYSPKNDTYSPGESMGEIVNSSKKGIENIVEKATSGLSGIQKLRAGLLKSQQYGANERADAIMELLDILSEEVDYFRTAKENEKDILNSKLKENPESFGYVSQMLNIIYQGKKLDSWMLMAQPPSRMKRLGGK